MIIGFFRSNATIKHTATEQKLYSFTPPIIPNHLISASVNAMSNSGALFLTSFTDSFEIYTRNFRSGGSVTLTAYEVIFIGY